MKFDGSWVLNLNDLIVSYFTNLGIWKFNDVVVCEILKS